jgi:UrcA family protein
VGSGNDQPDFETAERQARRAGNSNLSPLKLVVDHTLKDKIMNFVLTMLAFASLTVPAVATAAPSQQSMAVKVGDLNLESDRGQSILALRIQRAARTMCNAQALQSLPQNIRSVRRCIREVQSSAETAVKTVIAARDTTPGRGD